MLKYLVTGGLLAGASTYYYMGFNKAKYFTEKTVPPQLLIYKENVGEYRKMAPDFTELRKTLKDFKGNFVMTGILFNNLSTTKDPKKERALVGALVDPSQKAEVAEFLAKHPEYKVKDTKDMPAIASERIPNRKPMSYIWGSKKFNKGTTFLEGWNFNTPEGKATLLKFWYLTGQMQLDYNKPQLLLLVQNDSKNMVKWNPSYLLKEVIDI